MLVGMPSREEMRRMPDGAVSKHQAWEKRNKNRKSMWQNIMLTVHKGTDDDSVASFEKYRPMRTPGDLGMSSRRVGSNAMHSFPSDQYQDNYDEIDWRADRNLEDAGDLLDNSDQAIDRAGEFVDDVMRANDLAELRKSISEAREEEKESSGTNVPEQLSADALG